MRNLTRIGAVVAFLNASTAYAEAPVLGNELPNTISLPINQQISQVINSLPQISTPKQIEMARCYQTYPVNPYTGNVMAQVQLNETQACLDRVAKKYEGPSGP